MTQRQVNYDHLHVRKPLRRRMSCGCITSIRSEGVLPPSEDGAEGLTDVSLSEMLLRLLLESE